jgi:hypothetical protein
MWLFLEEKPLIIVLSANSTWRTAREAQKFRFIRATNVAEVNPRLRRN